MRRFTRALVMAGLSLLAPLSPAVDEDHRAWQHGIDFVQVGSRLLLVWGSPGNPPKPVLGGDWQHDVYYAWIDSTSDAITPNILVSRPEAQEPPSTAINSLGTLLMTSEDGNGGINQHAGLWTSALDVVRKYPLTIRRGGHSGHVAAMRDRFLVVYGEGWVEGGGFLNRGTGKDVHARIVENDGTLRREVKLTEAGRAHRDGWPLAAGSDRNWLVVWQRYPGMTLESALIDTSGAVTSRKKLMDAMPVRYAYDVEYAKSLDSYIVAGTSGSKGFISLVSSAGEIVASRGDLPAMASESRIVIGDTGGQVIGAYPVRPSGIAVVRLLPGTVELIKVIDHPYAWDYSGTTGVFEAPGKVLFATLSTEGVRLLRVDLGLTRQ